ncbi:uncharacterized protein CLUP02_08273 [Colletotrichum lupini]|uniref:Uncharacterized protein n=1 Tax=Colletotrichum lupini TaxID=145971 RepID=A0A9Q8SSS6_9PEZI|nr:uncharacterized protein CLUP02_08273 [Colletotrichum lupini]UQC82783.1 hypothetical protein CLUP02_08273 [Colletotrichum lupini]
MPARSNGRSKTVFATRGEALALIASHSCLHVLAACQTSRISIQKWFYAVPLSFTSLPSKTRKLSKVEGLATRLSPVPAVRRGSFIPTQIAGCTQHRIFAEEYLLSHRSSSRRSRLSIHAFGHSSTSNFLTSLLHFLQPHIRQSHRTNHPTSFANLLVDRIDSESFATGTYSSLNDARLRDLFSRYTAAAAFFGDDLCPLRSSDI